MRSTFWILLSTAAWTPITAGSQGGDPRDGEVYAATLDSVVTEPDMLHREQLVLQDSTSASLYEENYVVYRRTPADGFVAGLFREFAFLNPSVVSSFEDRNRQQALIPRLSLSRAPVVRVTTSAMSSLPSEFNARWRAFYKLYPRSTSLISVSRIGYNSDGDVAILMMAQHCGALCGQGYLIGLRKTAGKWHVAFIKRTWTS